MKTYYGSFYRPGYSEPVESTVLVFEKSISIGYRNNDESNATVNWFFPDILSSFEFGRQRTKVTSPKYPGMELYIEGKAADDYIRELQAERQKPWHKKSSGKEWIRNSMLFVVIVGALFLLYLLIVPWLSSKLASKVSIKTERNLGDAVYNAMGLSGNEDSAASFILNEFFAALDVKTGYTIRITVVKDATVNAFALPGGRIVVYDGLLREVNSYPELAALLSHEFTHINDKHSTKSIFRKLGSKVFIGLLFGRVNAVVSIVVDNADNLKSLKYSRSLEKDADTKGLAILMDRKIDPAGFTSLFEHLKEAVKGKDPPELFASHPDLDKRIKYVKEASAGATVTENARLKAIFEKLNKTNP